MSFIYKPGLAWGMGDALTHEQKCEHLQSLTIQVEVEFVDFVDDMLYRFTFEGTKPHGFQVEEEKKIKETILSLESSSSYLGFPSFMEDDAVFFSKLPKSINSVDLPETEISSRFAANLETTFRKLKKLNKEGNLTDGDGNPLEEELFKSLCNCFTFCSKYSIPFFCKY
jgi:hypothetical protein